MCASTGEPDAFLAQSCNARFGVALPAPTRTTVGPVPDARARSFGSVATAYDDFRPGYPAEAVDLSLEDAGRRVLDLGAGTGKLTAELVGRGYDVVAVEPDPAMLAVLRDRLPGVDARAGAAEDIPLPDGSVDAVLAGQALHWFEPERAAPELARVLRPGGVLAGLWNGDDGEVAWVAGIAEARGETVRTNPAGGGEGIELPGAPWFGAPDRVLVHWCWPQTTEGYLANLRTHSWALASEPADREAALERIRDYLVSRPETTSGRFDLPMRTVVERTRRR